MASVFFDLQHEDRMLGNELDNPMAIAILIGIIVNMTIKRNAQPWEIATSLYEDNNEDTDDNINPPGDIIRTYDWDLGFQRADNTTHVTFLSISHSKT